MGRLGNLFGFLFGGGRNVIADTVEVFRPNAEAGGRSGRRIINRRRWRSLARNFRLRERVILIV